MWANAQRDGRPAEKVVPSVQRRKVWLTPTTRCRAVTLQGSKPVEIFRGAPNYRIHLSRQWAEVHHIVGTYGGHIAA